MDDGSVIVVEIGAGTVTRVGADGSQEEVARPGGGPNGAAVGPDGNLYICNNGAAFDYLELPGMEGILVPRQPPSNYSGGRVERIDMGSGAVEIIYEECDGRPLRAPNDLVFDGHGGFYSPIARITALRASRLLSGGRVTLTSVWLISWRPFGSRSVTTPEIAWAFERSWPPESWRCRTGHPGDR